PLLVIGAIVAAIWWLESRGGDDVSPTGERYGPVELPTALQTTGLEIGVQEGNLAPDFLLGTLDGSEVRLSALRGQPVVLNFWATWCAPGREAIPGRVPVPSAPRGWSRTLGVLNPLRAVWWLFTNVRFAVVLLVLLCGLSLLGVVLPQKPLPVRGDVVAEANWVRVQEGKFGF